MRYLVQMKGGMKMDKMRLDDMEFYGYHGVFPEENKLGQKFYVSLVLYLDLEEAGRNDDLTKTIDYADVYSRVKSIVEGKPVQLIETVAEQIASDLLSAYTALKELVVKVRKPHPPFAITFSGVTVELQRKRAE